MQKQVALSSCEAEYLALTEAIKETLWLSELLSELGFPQGAVKVFVDNKSAIQLAKFPMLRPRSKHIGMRHHWIREVVQNKRGELIYIPTHENISDMFTKILGRVKMAKLLKGLME